LETDRLDISTSVDGVLRRWYVFILVLAIAAYAAVGAFRTADPVYNSSVTVTVLPSVSLLRERAAAGAGESGLGNPFGLTATTTLAALLADEINTGGISLPPEADDAVLTAVTNEQYLRTFFTVESLADSSEGVLAALAAVVQQSPEIVSEVQLIAGSPSEQLFTVLQTRNPTTPTVDYPDRARTVVGLGLAGLLLATLMSVTIDSLVVSRRDRKADRRSRARTGADAKGSSEAP
jgi:hypothetical protein